MAAPEGLLRQEKRLQDLAGQLKLQRFKETDWLAFGGATRFQDGSEPFIGQLSDGVLVVLDAEGITFWPEAPYPDDPAKAEDTFISASWGL